MKIFFTSSQTSRAKYPQVYDSIAKYLENNKYEMKSRKYVSFEGADPQELEREFINTYESTKKDLFLSDLIIAEASIPTASIGHEITLAIEHNKPTLVLINEEVELNKIPSSIRGNKSKLLITKYYNSKNIEQKVEEFLEQSKKMLDSKFIFIIPPEIERYLSWANKKKGIPKADIVRHAVENFMNEDIDYKSYLKDLNI